MTRTFQSRANAVFGTRHMSPSELSSSLTGTFKKINHDGFSGPDTFSLQMLDFLNTVFVFFFFSLFDLSYLCFTVLDAIQ